MEKEELIALAIANPNAFMREQFEQYKDSPYIKDALLAIAGTNGEKAGSANLLFNCEKFINEPYAEEILTLAAKEEPEFAFAATPKFQDQPYAPTILISAAKQDASAAMSKFQFYRGLPYAEQVIRAAAESDAETVVHDFADIRNEPYGKKILSEIAEQHPELLFESLDYWLAVPYSKEVLEIAAHSAAQNDSETILSWAYRKDNFYWLEKLPALSSQPYGAAVLKAVVENWAKEYPDILLSLYASYIQHEPFGRAVIKELVNKLEDKPDEILQNSYLFYAEPYAGEALQKATLRLFSETASDNYRAQTMLMVQQMNALHDAHAAQRFSMLKYMTPANEFDLITLGRAEAFTSTYKNILGDMLGKLKAEHKSLTDVLSPAQMDRMGIFLEAAASYGELDHVLAVIPKEKLPAIIHDIVTKAGEAENMQYATTLASIIKINPDNMTLRTALEREIRAGYEQAKDAPQTRHRFGLLAALYAQAEGSVVSDENKAFYAKLGAEPLYDIHAAHNMKKQELVDAKGACNQLMVFSDDEDGKASFAHWKAAYKGKAGWAVGEREGYVHIRSTAGSVPVHVYANMPDKQEEGIAKIREEVAARQGAEDASFQVFIGRGHSYHADDYLNYLSQEARLVHLGSCGGYQNVSAVMARAPQSQVISTQGTGSMYVNDPLLFSINQSINRQGGIDWSQQQKALDNIGSDNKEDYLLPHRNIAFLYLRRFEEIKDEPVISLRRAPEKMLFKDKLHPFDFVLPKMLALSTATPDVADEITHGLSAVPNRISAKTQGFQRS